MKYLQFGDKTELSKVIVGCMRMKDMGMGGKDLLRLVEQCLEMGITSFDHAPVYGEYTCEGIFGESVLKARPKLRSQLKLITKTGIALPGVQGNKRIYYNSSREYILKEVERSLRELHTDYIDLLLIHRPDVFADPAETAQALEELVKSGKVLEVGVSNYSPAGIQALESKLEGRVVTNQVEISVKHPIHFFDGVVDDAIMRGMPLMAWSPLGGGSVFHQKGEQSARLRELLEQVAADRNTGIDVIMYAWLFSHPADIAAITGTMKASRVKAAVQALEVKLSYDEWYGILEASRGYPVP